MALLEAARKAGRFVRDAATRARYSDETLRLLEPFINDEAVGAEWAGRFEYDLLRGKRKSFVDAACHRLVPRQRVKLLFILAETLGTDDFRPKDPSGNRNIIQDIWMRGNDKDSVMHEIESSDTSSEARQKVLQSLHGM